MFWDCHVYCRVSIVIFFGIQPSQAIPAPHSQTKLNLLAAAQEQVGLRVGASSLLTHMKVGIERQ